MKKIALILSVASLFAGVLFAAQLVSQEQVIKDNFPSGKVEKKTIVLSAQQISDVNKVFGVELVPAGEEKNEYTVFSGPEGNAVIDHHKGKWGEIKILTLVDSKTGAVKNVVVMDSSEKRGRPIVMKSFLKQFFGKKAGDKFEVGKNINGVSGATISSVSVCFVVKRAIAINNAALSK
jgi:Na+-translocating ferredoxin:NAD+ oxidoreductase RnfG subunit